MLHGLSVARQGDRGFTLIELQVVLVIVGVLSAVGFSGVQAVSNQTVKAACGADMSNVEIASAAYYADHGSYATAIDDLNHTPTTLVGARYLRKPPSSTRYRIVYRPADGSVLGEVGVTACGRPA